MQKKHIVVLGGGFGGLTFCQSFNHPNVQITLVDRQNHHLFQPLLYQVASAALSAPDIAQPIRSILRNDENVTVLLDTVTDFDLKGRRVILESGDLHYDYLIMALGGVTTYFNHPEWQDLAPGLKSLDDALEIRRRMLLAFERAETEQDTEKRNQLLTMVVVGGGPTGIELAGAFAELARHVLADDFRRIDPAKARVILIESSDRVLNNMSEYLSRKTCEQLERLGVEIRTGVKVSEIKPGHVTLTTGEVIHAQTVVWAAGVGATPLTKKLGVELDRAGRVKVVPDLSIPGYPEVFAIGDMAHVIDKDGQIVPGVSPGAIQMAKHVARLIREEMMFPGYNSRRAFDYWDKGTMATIGRSAAVAKIRNFEFSGYPAWLAWLFVHLIFLVGLRNKVAVLFEWAYSYFTYRRGSRIITGLSEETREQMIKS